jgi:hypothetical protein
MMNVQDDEAYGQQDHRKKASSIQNAIDVIHTVIKTAFGSSEKSIGIFFEIPNPPLSKLLLRPDGLPRIQT